MYLLIYELIHINYQKFIIYLFVCLSESYSQDQGPKSTNRITFLSTKISLSLRVFDNNGENAQFQRMENKDRLSFLKGKVN